MSDPSWHFAERLMDLRVAEEKHRADGRRLARAARGNAGLPLARRSRLWVAEAGFRLVVLGAWLEAHAQRPSLLSEEGLGASH